MKARALTRIDFGDRVVEPGDAFAMDEDRLDALPPGTAEPVAAPARLTDLDGLGRAAAKSLRAAGVDSPAALAALSEEAVEALEVSAAVRKRLPGWIAEARS